MGFFQKSPDQVGKELLSLCKTLAEQSTNTTEAVEKAKKVIPRYILKDADANLEKTHHLLGIGISEESILQPFVLYLYGYSLFEATRDAGFTGFLLKEAGRLAAGELAIIAMSGLEAKDYRTTMWASVGMGVIGDTLGDFYFKTQGDIFLALLSREKGETLTARMACQNALLFLPTAKKQYAHDTSVISTLENFEGIARGILNQSSS